MKRKLNKISMVVVATVMFGAALFLSMEKNEQGNWEFAAASSFAQPGGGETIVQFFHYNLETISVGVENFAEGRAQVDPYYAGGVASVVTPSYMWQSYTFTKTGDNSGVDQTATYYIIGYQADYTTSGVSVGNIVVLDSFSETI